MSTAFSMASSQALDPCRQPRRAAAFCILSVLIFIVYSNALQTSWHLDDYQNIVGNPRVQISDLEPSTLLATFFASPEGKSKPYRSVAYLSFGFNAYFGGRNVLGYHVVNIAVHVITAFLLCMTVLKIFETPNLTRRSNNNAFFVALLTATLWAVNPIQTQAVTYIVQRMAALAAFFYICGLYCYIAARLATSPNRKIALFIGCGGCYLLAVMSKENAALMPLSVLLVEFIFFRDLRDPKQVKLALVLLTAGAALVVALGAMIFGNPFGFLNGYPNRTFTPFERLLTETRVLVHYLSQIFYPVPTRLSLYHDVIVSKSLVDPWTTLPSLLVILTLITLGFKWIAHRPIISFAILFFFLNHLIESTVIGLELVFEHRNYLPSLFLFMPIAAGIDHLIRHYGRSNRVMHSAVISGVVLLVVGFASGTYIRNQAWADEKALWEDTLAKAPNSIRAHHELAYQHYEKTGNYDTALILYHRGLSLNGQNVYEKTLSLNNIASIHFTRGDYANAEKFWREAIASYPKYKQAYYRLALTQTKLGRWNEAAETLSLVDDGKVPDPNRSRLKGILLLRDNNPEAATQYFRNCIKMNPRDWQSSMYLGVAFSMMGHAEKAYRFLKMAAVERPNEPLPQLLLPGNRLTASDDTKVQFHLDTFITRVGPRQVETYLFGVREQYEFAQPFLADLQPLIANKIGLMAGELKEVAGRLHEVPVDLTETSETVNSDGFGYADGS